MSEKKKIKVNRKKKEELRMKISGTIKPNQFEWIEKKIKEGTYYNRSHALQKGIELLKKQDAGKES